ncbi:hypothetical protein D3C81_1414630 [compost metagenome]
MGAKHPYGFGIGSLYTGIAQVVQRGSEVAAAGDGAALVQKVATFDVQVATCGNAGGGTGGGHFQLVALHDLPDTVAFAAAVAGVNAFNTPDFLDFGRVDACVADGQQRTDVLNRTGGQAHAAVTLDQA